MATLLLSAAGSALGGAVGGSLLGVSAATIGQAAGSIIGNVIDKKLLGSKQRSEGPQLDNLQVQVSTEGAPLPIIYGHARVAGRLIWATNFEEVVETDEVGGKGGGGAEVTNYSYFANFAVAVADTSVHAVRQFGRVWADGEVLNLAEFTVRLYRGGQQASDPLMVAKDGDAPAYKGVAYAVFERFPVDRYGRRIPNLSFEVFGSIGEMEEAVRGVDIIPGATEFGYEPSPIRKRGADDSRVPENAERAKGLTNWNESMKLLGRVLPNVETVALVVSWFGTDLRAGECEIKPKVEIKSKATFPREWSAGGLDRASADLVSYVNGKPAFGSAPDDLSIMNAIKDLKERGYRVLLYPFIMMDIANGNELPDLDGSTGQPVYPWRGRISADYAGGGTVSAKIDALAGTAAPGDFSTGSDVPVYSGPAEWSYRRFILHLAALARNAGGVDAFLIGSELVGLTTSTSGSGSYPFVDKLVTLAADVAGMLTSAEVSYAADWSEYHSHRDGSDVYFHLDPLWSSAHIDFIGIDNYLPLSDWRGGFDHADYDAENGPTSIYDLEYLRANIEGGEYYDWFYASAGDRRGQVRTAINDSAHGEHWVFRQKDIRNWWGNAHHDRPGGVRSGSPTAWSASSKPIWFTEIGCPAIDFGTNQPNVFYSPISSEGAFPHYSRGTRDDFIQRQYIRAMYDYWTENGGSMVDPDNILVWTWDARPWPEFPQLSGLWSDGPDHRLGHWLNGRAGSAPAAETIRDHLMDLYGLTAAQIDVEDCYGVVDGLVLNAPASFREVFQPLEVALQLDAVERGGVIHFSSRHAAVSRGALTEEDLVKAGDGPLYTITRVAQEETPSRAVVKFADIQREYNAGAINVSIRDNPGAAEVSAELAISSDLDRMTGVGNTLLRAAAEGRDRAEFILPPSSTVEPGDLLDFTPRGGDPLKLVVEDLVRGKDRRIAASIHPASAYAPGGTPTRPPLRYISPAATSVVPIFMDLPTLPNIEADPHDGYIAARATPWPGGADVYRSLDASTGFSVNVRPSISVGSGLTEESLPPGRLGRWSPEVLVVNLFAGNPVAKAEVDVLDGANALAVEHSAGVWEVIQYGNAVLDGPTGFWHLSGLLRGQLGTEDARSTSALAAGARVVLLDASVISVAMAAADVGRTFYWRAVPAGGDFGDDEVTTHSHTYQGVGRRPFSPVHLAATLDGSDLDVSWIRRTRTEGDTWPDVGDVPLGETFERYVVEIGPEGAPLEAVTVNSATTATLDVSGLSAGPYEVRVYQVSETFGNGSPGRLAVTI